MQSIDYHIHINLLKPKWKLLRLDILPFLFIYIIVIYAYFSLIDRSVMEIIGLESTVEQIQPIQHTYTSLFMQCFLVVVGFLQCLTYIMGYWSKKMQVYIQYSVIKGKYAANLNNASHVHIIESHQEYNTHDITDLYMTQTIYKGYPLYFFHFQQQKYYYDFEIGSFQKVQLPIQGLFIKDAIKNYCNVNNNTQQIFDDNILEMPIRSFWELFREQIIDPFVFMQFFSAFLWLLDDNYQYSLMIIAMLLLSSYMMTTQRIKTLVGYRSMTLAPHQVYVLIDGKWIIKSSYELVPGNIILVTAGFHHKKVKYDMLTDEEYLNNAIPFTSKKLINMSNTSKEQTNTSYRAVPCDILLLSGSCTANQSIMTGQAIPQTKQSIVTEDMFEKFHQSRYKSNTLFCGTEILQIDESYNLKQCAELLPLHCTLNKLGANGCIGMVLRTGFNTEKGHLIRKVLASSQQLKLEQKDALWILLFLLTCSLITAGYVLQQGFQNKQRDKRKLFLRCILIVTTVVPPQLPMILTLAVNNSILYLQKKKIYVSEPKKLPLGGKVNIIAFDKTGTLTEDKFIFEGIVDNCSQFLQCKQFQKCQQQCLIILAGCHSLINVDKKLTGDPIELMLFQMTNWTYQSKSKEARKLMQRVIIQKRYPFKSQLKRMSVIAEYVRQNGTRKIKVLTKGAPETIEPLLAQVPEKYRQAYNYYTAKGFRLLCLASRDITREEINQQLSQEQSRKMCQNKLTFAGFFICVSPLKQDTYKNIQALKKAQFRLMIITGDNILTAIKVAKNIGLGEQAWTLQMSKQNKLLLSTSDGQNYDIHSLNELLQYLSLKKDTFLCTSSTNKISSQYYQYITVFARTSPYDKEIIVKKCKQEKGCGILYAGDGTNDVGGLRMADVGVAVVGISSLSETDKKQQKLKKQIKELNQRMNIIKYDVKIPFKQKMSKINLLNQEKILKSGGINGMLIEDEIKLGDACIAAPFTSKHSNSIKCVIFIIRQAITTLVGMIQTYKVLAISSILQAYALAEMNLVSLKYSHSQSLLLGFIGIVNYYYFSNAKPAQRISHIRAPNTIFSIWFALSFFGQIIIFVFTNYYALNMIGLKYLLEEDKSVNADEQFKSSFLNTVIVLFTIISQSAIFLINRGGQPHMQSVLKNPRQLKFLIIPLGIGLVLTMNLIPSLSEVFNLKYDKIPIQANYEMLGLFCFTMISGYLLQRICRFGQYGEVIGWL